MADRPVALVTGAALGQGAEHVRRLTADGFEVVASDVRASHCDDAPHDGPRSGPTRLRQLDVADEAGWTDLVASVLDEFGRIDVLVNNAGINGSRALIEDTPLDAFQQVIAVNQVGLFLGMRAVIPTMREARSGSIINVSSVAGMGGKPGRIAYQASKWAVRGMTRTAALELAEFGVRVNAIVPGVVDTPMMASVGISVDDMAAQIPLGRIAQPDEISALVSFLASPESRYITGTDLIIDGGVRAQI